MKRLFFCFAAACCAVCAAASSVPFPPLEPAFEISSASSKSLSPSELIRAALLFSGCTEDSAGFSESFSVYQKLEAAVSSSHFMSLDEEERAEAVLSLMYEQVLVRYRENASRMDEMLCSGIYNCVSSSVLYYALATAAGISVAAQRTPEHSFCTAVLSNGTRIDVETTNPMGFNPGKRRPVSSSSYYVVPKKKYSGRHEISGRQFAGLIARNRCSLAMTRNDYETAVPLAAARMRFMEEDESKTADDSRADFFLVCSNYSAYLQGQSKFEDAVIWLEQAANRWNGHELIQKQYDGALFNAAAVKCNAGQYKEAAEFYEPRKDSVSLSAQKNIEAAIFMATVQGESRKMDDDSAISYLVEKLASMKSGTKDYRQVHSLLEVRWHSKITAAAQEFGWLEAAGLCKDAVQSLPSSSRLKTLHAQCLRNYDAQVHNEFAMLANSGRTEEARTVLEKGLSANPSSRILARDLQSLVQ